MLGHFFYEAVDIVRTAYPDKAQYLTGLAECAVQGYSSTTYLVSFTGVNTVSEVILQLRKPDRPLNTSVLETARGLLGDLVPKARLLTEYTLPEYGKGSLLAYEMSRIPGMSLSEFSCKDEYINCLPLTAEGLGTLLGKCCVPGKSAPSAFKRTVRTNLEKAAKSTDLLLAPYLDDFRELLDTLQVFDCLPAAISNGDLHFTNIFVDEHGRVTGLVDWEAELLEVPLGFDLCFLQWILCDLPSLLAGEGYKQYPNASHIEDRFWKAFLANLPSTIRITRTFIAELEQAMRFGAAFFHANSGKCNLPSCIEILRIQLDYTIPVERLGLNLCPKQQVC